MHNGSLTGLISQQLTCFLWCIYHHLLHSIVKCILWELKATSFDDSRRSICVNVVSAAVKLKFVGRVFTLNSTSEVNISVTEARFLKVCRSFYNRSTLNLTYFVHTLKLSQIRTSCEFFCYWHFWMFFVFNLRSESIIFLLYR